MLTIHYIIRRIIISSELLSDSICSRVTRPSTATNNSNKKDWVCSSNVLFRINSVKSSSLDCASLLVKSFLNSTTNSSILITNLSISTSGSGCNKVDSFFNSASCRETSSRIFSNVVIKSSIDVEYNSYRNGRTIRLGGPCRGIRGLWTLSFSK